MNVAFHSIWDAQACDESFLKRHLKTVLMDQNKQNWHEQVNNSNKCATYKLIKTSLKFETYLMKLPSYLANRQYRNIEIEGSLRQGGVLSVPLFAKMMDTL